MYMLDTNIVIYAIKNKPEQVLDKITKLSTKDVCLSSITYSELVYGVEKSANVEKNWLALSLMLSNMNILSFDNIAAEEYGKIRADLENSGEVIMPMDILIAAHAKSSNCILVTNNEKEFKRVKNLEVENWT